MTTTWAAKVLEGVPENGAGRILIMQGAIG